MRSQLSGGEVLEERKGPCGSSSPDFTLLQEFESERGCRGLKTAPGPTEAWSLVSGKERVSFNFGVGDSLSWGLKAWAWGPISDSDFYLCCFLTQFALG